MASMVAFEFMIANGEREDPGEGKNVIESRR